MTRATLTQKREAITLANRHLDRSIEPNHVFLIARHRTRSGNLIITPIALCHYERPDGSIEAQSEKFTFGRTLCETAGFSWSSSYMGWVVPDNAGEEPRSWLTRELSRALNRNLTFTVL
jgi:hypothetical protein